MALNMNEVAGKEQKRIKHEPVPRGSHMARLVAVTDLGLQPRPPWGDQEKKPCYRVRLTFELPKQRIEVDGESRPKWLDKELNVSTFENSNMVKFYEVLDPDNVHKGDLTKLIGAPCAVIVVHNEKDGNVYDNIQDITPLMDGIEVPELENPPRVFDLSSPDMEQWERLPKFLQDKIKSNLEFKGSKLERILMGQDVPVTASTPEIDEEQALDEAADGDQPW